jgi:hypothetical protein
MDRSEDVQFVDDGSFATSDDDVVALGPGRFPRWLTAVLVAAALVAVVAVVLSRGSGMRDPATAGSRSSAAPAAAQTQGVGNPFPIGPTAAVDVAVAGGRIYALQAGRIAAVDPLTRRVVAQAQVPGADPSASLRLLPDAADARIWVVSFFAPTGLLAEYDARSLRLLRSVTWHAPIRAATILGGDLYFTTTGIAAWPAAAPAPRVVPALAYVDGPVTADPTRHRVLIADAGGLRSYRPGGTLSAPVHAPVMKGELVVVHGAVWFVGFAVTGSAVVAPVDPVTLRVGDNAGVVVDLGNGAEVAGVGTDVIWVRNGSGSGGLWCVDARDGRVYTSWGSAPGNVASVSHAGYLATGFALVPLIMGTCPG